ncbi:PREDICTED: lisH domain-containing protein FOPNL [Chrysochloris asiatica]|uniref:Centrosomal protein 20 n=1 Tax=Chrysochloris asiatica TaxID=185453 RepID=A0A9B0U213_CHRAS|nr:PREDICTED: lisH domain-containing protein FOPNL [Chrysochloris asiatica]
MATVTELKAVLKDTLEKKGVLGHLKARIRAEVFNALDDDREPRPPLSHENLLINELIREYLEFNKYKYTSSVLVAESGQPAVPLDRQFLIRELNSLEEPKDNTIPLLYGILAHFLHGSKDGIQNAFRNGSSLQLPSPNFSRQQSRRKKMAGRGVCVKGSLPRTPLPARPLGTIFSQGERAARGWYAALGIPAGRSPRLPFLGCLPPSAPHPPRPDREDRSLSRAGAERWDRRRPGLARGQPTATTAF